MISGAADDAKRRPFSPPAERVASFDLLRVVGSLGTRLRLPSAVRMHDWLALDAWARLLLTAALSPLVLAGGGDYDVLSWAAPAAAALAVAALAVAALALAVFAQQLESCGA